ncbi:MAG TPA: FAD-dependent monooxygenase [Acidobacteriaceae bacterium]|nr:FAD-dependent monooxygenase [Acidobacteriaceae bacterium]
MTVSNPTADLDAVILGGGPAGAAAAIELALAGRRVVLLERTLHAHHKVCGDFLSGEALSSLEALGLNVAALGAVPIHRVRLAGGFGVPSATLPFAAQSLTRRALDDALLRRASAAGALVLRGHTAQALHRSGNLWQVGVSGPSRSYTLSARHILLATGKHDLRGLPRPEGTHTDLVGLKMYLRLAPEQSDAIRDTIELALFRGGYGGLSLVEDTAGKRAEGDRANLCFVIQRSHVRDLGRDWSAITGVLTRNPHLRTRLAGAHPLLERPLAISPIPYGHLLRQAIAEDLFAIGDQAAVIPSFTGDGLAIALHSGRLAARALLAGHSSHEFHAELYGQLHRQISLATMLSRALVTQPQRSILSAAACVLPGVLRSVASCTRLASQHQVPAQPFPASHENTCTAA